MVPQMSDETGFPHVDGMPPYATCLRVLEECPLVIVIIDRRYGRPFKDWGPYPQYAGCGPTHAELRHALSLGKRVLIFVHNDTWNFYEFWRKNADAMTGAPEGLDTATLEMFRELKLRQPVPWIHKFSDSADVIRSLQGEFVNQLYEYLRERQDQTTDLASYLLGKIFEAAPEVRAKIEGELTPKLSSDRQELERRLADIRTELENTRGATEESLRRLAEDKKGVEERLQSVTAETRTMQLMLARAALKDASWLTHVRTTLMPKQPGGIPFHNSAEVAIRGYHALAGAQGVVPKLESVTWAVLPKKEGILSRGYDAGVILTGSNFIPGITYRHRRRGAVEPDWWHLPSIYFCDYLELAAMATEADGQLNFYDYEFQVRNPEGQVSEWVPYSTDLNLDEVKGRQAKYLEEGKKLMAANTPDAAFEPLRKAWLYADRLFGTNSEETKVANEILNNCRDVRALERLRFRVGAELVITSGPYAGARGTVVQLLLNHVHAYVIKPEAGNNFQASDDQVAVAVEATTAPR